MVSLTIDQVQRDRLRRDAETKWQAAKRSSRRERFGLSDRSPIGPHPERFQLGVELEILSSQLARERAAAERKNSEALRQRSGEMRTSTRAIRQHSDYLVQRFEEINRVCSEAWIRLQSFTSVEVFEDLVDRALARWGERLQMPDGIRPDPTHDRRALVVSTDLSEMVHIQGLLSRRFRQVMGGIDTGTTLALAMIAQPDLAVIDEKLEYGNGVDLALALPLYAPLTKAVVLTDDPDAVSALRTVGFDAHPRDVAEETLLASVG